MPAWNIHICFSQVPLWQSGIERLCSPLPDMETAFSVNGNYKSSQLPPRLGPFPDRLKDLARLNGVADDMDLGYGGR